MKCMQCDETEIKQTETYKDILIYECPNGHRFGFIKEEKQETNVWTEMFKKVVNG